MFKGFEEGNKDTGLTFSTTASTAPRESYLMMWRSAPSAAVAKKRGRRAPHGSLRIKEKIIL
jgi:hypothetical protein